MSETNPTITREAKSPWFDPITAILIAMTSLGTAWCSYQGSLWSDLGKELGIQADKLDRQVSSQHLDALVIQSMHVRGWMEAVDAHLEGDLKREKFYTDRFRDELQLAYDKWIAHKPYDNESAPLHPFVASLYEMRFTKEIAAATKLSEEVTAQASTNEQTASSYLANTVILAIVLFCIGMVEKFDRRKLRVVSFVFASSLLLYAMVRIVSLPIL